MFLQKGNSFVLRAKGEDSADGETYKTNHKQHKDILVFILLVKKLYLQYIVLGILSKKEGGLWYQDTNLQTSGRSILL